MPMAANVSQSTEYNFHALNFYSTNICCFSSRSFFFSFFSSVLLYLFLWNNSSSASFSLNLHQFIFIIILFIIIGARTKVHFLVDMAGGGQNNNMKRASSSIFFQRIIRWPEAHLMFLPRIVVPEKKRNFSDIFAFTVPNALTMSATITNTTMRWSCSAWLQTKITSCASGK